MKNYILNLLLFFIPSSRFYGLKRKLMRICGHSVSNNVRVMRIRIGGTRCVIGENSFIGDETMFWGSVGTQVVIGKNCDISTRVNFVTGSHYKGTIEHAAGKGYGKDIIVENGVWIGFNVTILPGITIHKGAIVAAGAVVTKDVPSGCIVAGVPAKVIKSQY